MSVKDKAEVLRGMFSTVFDRLRYHDLRRHRIDSGYVQQHTLSLTAQTGAVFLSGVCMAIYVSEGKLTRGHLHTNRVLPRTCARSQTSLSELFNQSDH